MTDLNLNFPWQEQGNRYAVAIGGVTVSVYTNRIKLTDLATGSYALLGGRENEKEAKDFLYQLKLSVKGTDSLYQDIVAIQANNKPQEITMTAFQGQVNHAVQETFDTLCEVGELGCAGVFFHADQAEMAYVHAMEADGTSAVSVYASLLAQSLPKTYRISHNKPTDGTLLVTGGHEAGLVYDPYHLLKEFIKLVRRQMKGEDLTKHYLYTDIFTVVQFINPDILDIEEVLSNLKHDEDFVRQILALA